MDIDAIITEYDSTELRSPSPAVSELSRPSSDSFGIRVTIPAPSSSGTIPGPGGAGEARRKSLPATPKSPSSDSSPEKVGRWSEEEHRVFLEGLEKHGKQWKTIALMIGTRTVVQVRTHAQKYFQKMERHSKPSTSPTSSSAAGEVASSNPQPCPPSTSSTISPSAASAVVGSPVTKRKSLPASLPSRKKYKSPTKKPRASISLAPASISSSPPPELPTHHSYASSGSMGSENWSTVSPSGVTDIIDFSCLEGTSGKSDHYYFAEEGFLDVTAEGGISFVGGEDPLEWLVDGEAAGIMNQYLPESSLPFFPDLNSCASAIDAHHVKSCEFNKDMLDEAILNNMADPNLTVQALFLPDMEDLED